MLQTKNRPHAVSRLTKSRPISDIESIPLNRCGKSLYKCLYMCIRKKTRGGLTCSMTTDGSASHSSGPQVWKADLDSIQHISKVDAKFWKADPDQTPSRHKVFGFYFPTIFLCLPIETTTVTSVSHKILVKNLYLKLVLLQNMYFKLHNLKLAENVLYMLVRGKVE